MRARAGECPSAKAWFSKPRDMSAATCTETASPSVPADAALCSAVSDLSTNAECLAVQTSDTSDGDARACTYTPVIEATAHNDMVCSNNGFCNTVTGNCD